MLVDEIASVAGVGVSYVENLARTADHRYKIYKITKRNGQGERRISQPTPPLKFIQRWIIVNVTHNIPIHPVATAYSHNCSTRRNAEMHVANNFLLRLDFKDFFPSIKRDDLKGLFDLNRPRLRLLESAADIDFVLSVVTRRGVLAIGAPSSPALSNQVMYGFDSLLNDWCIKQEIAYTRYADDIYLSTCKPNVLRTAHEQVRQILETIPFPHLKLNEEKTTETSRKKKRLVTGLSLTSDGRISLGRAKKREIKALVHRLGEAGLDPDKADYLAGYLAYARSVEPGFVQALERKYGEEKVRGAMTVPKSSNNAE